MVQMKIAICTSGKVKEPIKTLLLNYLNRISKYAATELKEYKSKDYEKKLIESKNKSFLVLLDERGKELDSKELASFLEEHTGKNICFAIGPAEGFSGALKKEADFTLSLSRLTLQHDLAALVLSEALYRSFTIINNHPYHKD